MESLNALYRVIEERRVSEDASSYTKYLFQEGLDKILKKIGEESAEVIIAAKNKEQGPLSEELCDLLYHLTVLCVHEGVSLDTLDGILMERGQKIGNKKESYLSDHNS